MAKLTLRDIAGKLKEKLQQGATSFAQTLPPVQAYNAVKSGINTLNKITPGGIQGGVQRVQQAFKTNPQQFNIFATPEFKKYGTEPLTGAVKSAVKFAPPYQAYRSLVGNPVRPKEVVTDFARVAKGVGALTLGPAGYAVSAGLGAITNPKNPIQGAYKGIESGQQYGGLTRFSNPLISKLVPAGLLTKSGVGGRIIQGGLNVAENMAQNVATNRPLTEGNLIALGMGAGGKQFSPNAKGFTVGRSSKTPWTSEDIKVVEGISDFLKSKQTTTPELKNKIYTNINDLADGYLPKTIINKVIKKYKEQDSITQGLVNELKKVMYKSEDAGNVIKMGIAGDNQLKPNAAQAGLSVPSTKGVESVPVDPFEADMIKYNNELSNAAKLPKTKKPFIDTSRQSTDVGDIKSNIGENGGVVDSIKRSFADWVNTRKASQVEGILQGRSFADLKEKGMQGIFEFQSGDKTGRYADVKNYFDTKYGQMQEKGIDFNYKEDYLTQIWDNTSEEISRVFGRSLSKTPSFTLESLIKNYQEGINAGLKPKYNNIPDLIQSYESATNKAIADHDFFRTLIKENMITTGSKAPRDWVTIDPDRFPRFSVKTDDGTYRGIYKAPPELAKMLNNYLGGAKFEWLAKAADWTSSVKNRVLSFGIPGTAINAHGFNILARNVMASKNPIEGAITGTKYMLNPISAQRQLDATLAKAPEAVKYGLTLSANEFTNILQEPQGFRSKFGDVWNKLFERGLFDRMLPALKLQKFTEVFEGYKKGGMNEYEAGKAAAKFTNDVFGGINIDELGKSRDFENMLRVTILAPDWLKTNLNLAGKIPQSFTTKILDPKMSAYRKFATTMLGSYITANIVNKLTSGHWMYQNDPGNSFNIEAGYTEDGQKRYIRPFGTAADFVRLPSDVLTALKKGDVSVVGRLVRNRLSIPLGVGIGMMTDTDYAGQPIGWRGTDKYGNEMPLKQRIAGVGGEVLTLAGMPSFMKQGIDYASGKTGGEQALLQAFELPVRYSGGAFNKSSQFIKGLGQREGAKGKELYDLIKSVKGVTLSKNQKELLTQNGLKSLLDIMQQKKINSMNTQVQKIKEDIVSGSLTQEEGAVKIQDIVNQIPEVSTNKKGADNSLVSTASASDELNKPYVFQYTSPSGKISIESVDLSKDIPEPKLTGNKELDKKLISTYKGELTSRATYIRKLYEAGKIDANQAEKLLGELKIKSGSVGGVKKPKKITLKVSSYKAPKITIKKRSTKLPTIKFKKPKKTKIVRRYTIK